MRALLRVVTLLLPVLVAAPAVADGYHRHHRDRDRDDRVYVVPRAYVVEPPGHYRHHGRPDCFYDRWGYYVCEGRRVHVVPREHYVVRQPPPRGYVLFGFGF